MKNIVIIGAGIVGASTAYELAKRGWNVTIIDREDKGRATDAAAGIICPWLSQRRNKAWYAMVKGGAKHYPELVNELEALGIDDIGYQNVGTLCLHEDMDKLEKMAERAQKRKEDAPEIGDIHIFSPMEVKKRFPIVKETYGAVFVSGGARVDGRKMREALMNAAKKHGAIVLSGDAKLKLGLKGTWEVILGDTVLESEDVMVAAGAWASQITNQIGVKLAISPQKAQIVHSNLEGEDTSMWPVVMPPGNQYMVTFGPNRIVTGATHEDEKGFDNRPTLGALEEITSKALAVAPGLQEATYVETRVGFRPVAPNFLPIIGELPGKKGIHLINGLGASGLTSGPFLGAEMAKALSNEKTELDWDLYKIENALIE
ncbi:NAD(P)/FAD-dependent oxidoreductase [Mangrovibacillus cuniculi]|uniref:FAD-binding oxidoreductase n=1 Tax=Mangrovibacillus cuniculi TaxID=2593652 RepID=A0A7S8C963_9BACI|nr:FAD-dependent oxidoreductase [Mangrovibacillus cuniculi]QPC45706.1 FAD-binding oxidoreductase [Mangrovibacillus cuniculi]